MGNVLKFVSKEYYPEKAFVVHPETGELVTVKRYEKGYYPSKKSTEDAAKNQEIADKENEARGVSKAQAKAMLFGSMFGWEIETAEPENFDEDGNWKGE